MFAKFDGDDIIMGMDIIIKKLQRCDYCHKPLELSVSKGTKRRYCSDAHRKYAWKKRHWVQYLSWQRDYVRRKKFLGSQGTYPNLTTASAGASQSEVAEQAK
jgi:hypothetical protein